MQGRYHYPLREIYADYLRAGGGLVLTAGPLLLLDLASVVRVVFGALALLFGWFAWRTLVRQRSPVELSAQAIACAGPRPCRIPWVELDQVRLAYYAPRRARNEGWFQLTLRGRRGGALKMDSSLEGFDRLLGHVLEHAQARELALDETTTSNLEALGVSAVGGPSRHVDHPG